MKKILFVAAMILLIASFAFAAAPKTYQVSGPVLELTDDAITVQKGKEKWEIARDPSTKVNGDLKAGSKVTIHYQMKATSIDVKETPAKGEKPGKATPPKK